MSIRFSSAPLVKPRLRQMPSGWWSCSWRIRSKENPRKIVDAGDSAQEAFNRSALLLISILMDERA